jgi:hypothetical protein
LSGGSGESVFIFFKKTREAWASAGAGKGVLLPPPRPATAMFLDFFSEKNSIFFVVFKAKSRFLPPWKILPSPGKKSADAHEERCSFSQTTFQIRMHLKYLRVT